MTDLVEITDAEGVRTVRMNRPDKKNALTGVMYSAMAEAIEDASDNDNIGAVLIAGVPGAFSAGNDMNDFMAAASGTGTLSNDIMRLLHALPRSEKPLVAAVQGLAIGIGTTMLFHCDYVVVGEDARLATPFISLGILPETDDPASITTEQISEALGGVEISEQDNVSKVLSAVVEGSCEVGTTYYSDTYGYEDELDILQTVSYDLTGDVIYPIARVVNEEADEAQSAAADDFLAFVLSDEAKAVFDSYYFDTEVE